MDSTLRIGGHLYRLVAKSRLAPVSRACYGKHRYTLERVADGSVWEAYGARLTPGSELLCRGGRYR
ncbi:hypothetical protein [Nocardia spumae]|uniref:hypothetical protein n=1 Tax=Nocardia spumae TaxID=2887190 RepID=UPI001D1563CD|nr:hypothetical protein [Nocardia spumae]